MRQNNLYRNLSREKSASVLFHLYNRHDRMAGIYNSIAEEVTKDHLRSWFSSLAAFRQQLADELRPLVADMGEVPLTPSREMRPHLHGRDDEIARLINQDNTPALIDLSLESEEAIAQYYQKAQANKEIPADIRQKLDRHLDRLTEVIRRARRLHAVPEQEDRDASFQL